MPSPIHHGLHSDLPRILGKEQRRIVAIPYSSRVAFGPRVLFFISFFIQSCHPLFITGCIRTGVLTYTTPAANTGCHPLFITGCIRTALQDFAPCSQGVAIPYSSRVAFGPYKRGLLRRKRQKLPSPIHHGLHSDMQPLCIFITNIGSCHPLFITGCIRT